MSVKQTTQCISVLMLSLLLGNNSVAVAEIPVGHFTDITPVLADPQYTDWNPTVTADGLTMIFTNYGYRLGNPGNKDLYMATRTNTEEPFGNVTNLGSGVNTADDEESSSISPDGQTLYFGALRRGRGEHYDLYQATRDGDGSFGNVMNLGPGVNTGRYENRPCISADELTIYYNDQQSVSVGQRRIVSADRLSTNVPFGNAQDLGDTVNGPPGAVSRARPSISTDEKFLFYFFRYDSGARDMLVSTRPTTDVQFGPPVNINDLWPGTEINTDAIETSMHISRDWPAPGSKIYFTSDRLGIRDIFQATWVPEPSAFILATLSMLSLVAYGRRRR